MGRLSSAALSTFPNLRGWALYFLLNPALAAEAALEEAENVAPALWCFKLLASIVVARMFFETAVSKPSASEVGFKVPP